MEPDNYEMTQAEIAKAFNEWMRRFIADPVRYEVEFRSVMQFTAETSTGTDNSYGIDCAAYLLKLHREITA